eukprot:jgi/Ulvmu1/6072/UM027_0050.1
MACAKAQVHTPACASLPQAGQVWRYVCNVNPLSTNSELSQVDHDTMALSETLTTVDVGGGSHSANSDSVHLAISAALADSFKLASSTQLTSSGLVPATLDVDSASTKHPAAGDKTESATLATIVWPGTAPQNASSSAPQHTVSSRHTSPPRSPAARLFPHKSVLSTHASSAVPDIISDDPIMQYDTPPSTVELYPIGPPTPPNESQKPLYACSRSLAPGHRHDNSQVARRFTTPLNLHQLPRGDSFPATPNTMSPRSSLSPLPHSPSMRSRPSDLSPATSRGGWVRRSIRRSPVRLGADRPPSLSPSRHTPAAGGAAQRSAGSAALRPTASAVELSHMATDSLAGSVVGDHIFDASADALEPMRTGRGALRRADSSGSQRSITPPASVANSSFVASPRLPWAPRTERRRPVKLGAASKSPATRARHPPAALSTTPGSGLSSTSFLDEYEDAASIVRLRHSSTLGANVLRPSASAMDMLADRSTAGGASFMSAAAHTDAPSDACPLSPHSRLPSLASRLGGSSSSRMAYLRALHTAEVDAAARKPAAEEIRLGAPALNFRTYDFALSRQFTFSDGTRIRMPQDPSA